MLIKTVESYVELRRAHASRARSSTLTRGYWFFDSFNGFVGVPGAPARLVGESANYYAAPLERVRRSFARYGVHNNSHVHFVNGIFEETLRSTDRRSQLRCCALMATCISRCCWRCDGCTATSRPGAGWSTGHRRLRCELWLWRQWEPPEGVPRRCQRVSGPTFTPTYHVPDNA